MGATPRRIATRHQVPTGPVVDLLDEWAKRNPVTPVKIQGKRFYTQGQDVFEAPRNPLNDLGERAGIEPRRLRRILAREYESIHFDDADRLLSAANMSDAWYREPLSAYYGPFPIFPDELDRSDVTDEERAQAPSYFAGLDRGKQYRANGGRRKKVAA